MVVVVAVGARVSPRGVFFNTKRKLKRGVTSLAPPLRQLVADDGGV